MPWLPAAEITGTVIRASDWDAARRFLTEFDTVPLMGSDVTLEPHGLKPVVTYTGAQNLDNILGTRDGDVIILSADVTGAGGNLTIRNQAGGTGNIRTNFAVDIEVASDLSWSIFINRGGLICGGEFFAPP